MTWYLISFGAHAMDHIPDEDMPVVAKAAHAAAQEAVNVSVFVCAGGLEDERASIVAIDGTVIDGPYPEAIRRAHGRRGALTRGGDEVGCQDRRRLPLCAKVREFGRDPELDEMLRQADR